MLRAVVESSTGPEHETRGSSRAPCVRSKPPRLAATPCTCTVEFNILHTHNMIVVIVVIVACTVALACRFERDMSCSLPSFQCRAWR